MAGILDYYKEHPELFAENEYLLAKDPAYNLGMMDLGAMSFEERPGGKMAEASSGIGRFLDKISYMLGRKPRYKPLSRIMGAYHPPGAEPEGHERAMKIDPGDIGIYTGPFTKGDIPTYWTDPNIVPPSERMSEPVFNLDKATVIAHEGRHKLTDMYPELYGAQPTWTGLNVQSDDPDAEQTWIDKMFDKPSKAERKVMKRRHWRNEAFNRFMDMRNFPDFQFRGINRKRFPSGLSAINIKPTDMYFDKIWKDKWEKSAKKYDKKLKEIAARKNIPGTPIVPMDRGRDEPDRGGSERTFSRTSPGGISQATSRAARSGMSGWRLAKGGIIDKALPGRSRDI